MPREAFPCPSDRTLGPATVRETTYGHHFGVGEVPDGRLTDVESISYADGLHSVQEIVEAAQPLVTFLLREKEFYAGRFRIVRPRASLSPVKATFTSVLVRPRRASGYEVRGATS